MATTSFDKCFVVTDQESIERIYYDLAHPRLIKVAKCDYKAESAKGLKLLKQRLSKSETFWVSSSTRNKRR
ncbi:hypothetical protein [Nitrincola nitratireducens]|uniref:Uncharacterized protein n=1 Tax=Nitrincola nitratireducens TaxID=1229521 RepID=W9V4H5_9GAMM|nr:hypothetical protein [Nitrincola nitratireducens]EXJ11027.1 hypothetical protein D791_02125 [Nitrincola nitratireducens]